MKRKKKPTNQNRSTTSNSSPSSALVAPFVEHVQELRRRLYYIAASMLVWGAAAYGIQQHIVAILLRPAKGQHFIYTSPGGGINFLFQICIYSGFIVSLPVIVYNSLRFIEPLITRGSTRFILWGSAISGLLAAAGMLFGYYLGLPAALHFLLHQFTTVQIQPLVTIQSYFGFVVMYMVGSALLFQLPLLLISINRIKPLNPRRLARLSYQRWIILAAFVLAFLMNPTPNIVSQLLIAVPFMVMYQVGLLLIWIINRPKRTAEVRQLAKNDTLVQAERQQRPVQQLSPLAATVRPVSIAAERSLAPTSLSLRTPVQPIVRQASLPPRRFMDFVPTRSISSVVPES